MIQRHTASYGADGFFDGGGGGFGAFLDRGMLDAAISPPTCWRRSASSTLRQ